MQKVVVLTLHTGLLTAGDDYTEQEYPLINQYLEAGYTVKQIVPVLPPTSEDDIICYSLVFVLDNRGE